MRSVKLGTLELSAEPSAGIVLAASLGALPVAVMGLEFAWVVVTAGAALLVLAPWLAARQVTAVLTVTPPKSQHPTVLHAARTLPFSVTLNVRRAARDVLVALQPAGGSQEVRDASPRLLIAAMAAGRHEDVQLPLRMAGRGTDVPMDAEVRSSFPFGLFTATRRLRLDLVVTALPRLFRAPAGMQAHAFMDRLIGLSMREVRQRPRGQGLPTTPRPARTGDTMRDINLRASVRRMAWIAVDRAQLGHEHAKIELSLRAVGDTGKTASRRGQQAAEVAVSLAGALASYCLEQGLTVTLSCGEDGSTAEPICSATSTRRHWLALVDVDTLHMRCAAKSGAGPDAPRPREASLVIAVRPALFIDGQAGVHEARRTTILSVDPYGRIQRHRSRVHRPRPPVQAPLVQMEPRGGQA